MSIGDYSQSYITDAPCNPASEAYKFYDQTVPTFPNEGVYIYSFEEGRMLYAKGWEDTLGYKAKEINMLAITNMSAPKYATFVHELNDKALMFILGKKTKLESYGFAIEFKMNHKDGHEVPVKATVRVFDGSGGAVRAIIGRFQVDHSLRFGNVMRYSGYGPDKDEFEEALNKTIFKDLTISGKEKEALNYVAKGFTFKQIALELNVSQSAIEKRILPLYKRFNVKSLSHLVSFAYDNHILP